MNKKITEDALIDKHDLINKLNDKAAELNLLIKEAYIHGVAINLAFKTRLDDSGYVLYKDLDLYPFIDTNC